MPRLTTRATALTFAGLGLMGALAACAPASTGGGGDRRWRHRQHGRQLRRRHLHRRRQLPGAERHRVDHRRADPRRRQDHRHHRHPARERPDREGPPGRVRRRHRRAGRRQGHRHPERHEGLRLLAHQRRLQDRHHGDQGRGPGVLIDAAVALPSAWDFEAIGAPWRIETPDAVDASQRAAVLERIERFDRDWSRFREDSLVSRIAREPGRHRLPADAGPCSTGTASCTRAPAAGCPRSSDARWNRSATTPPTG